MSLLKKYLLIEVIDREIHPPLFFETFEAAYEEMSRRFDSTKKSGESDPFAFISSRGAAYCENEDSDLCDWKIFKTNEGSE